MRAKPSIALASVLIGAVAALSGPAHAACKKFGFTVNDYGKDGPTNDAKNLLDKHISEWAAQNGVGEYSTGKKNVSCELFLDVILFDEHTCTASATVCWGPDAKKLGTQSAAAPVDESGAAGSPPAPVRKAHALGGAAPVANAPAAATAAAQTDAGQVDAAPTQPVEQISAPDDAPPVPLTTAVQATTASPATHSAGPITGTTGGVVETGTLQAGQALSQAAPPTAKVSGPTDKDRAAAAAAAASAAAAAERAAMAAETAANAAKEAAAAAVAASAASRAGITVPPLDQASGARAVHTE